MKLYAPFSHRVLGLIISILMFASFAFAAGDVDTNFLAGLTDSGGGTGTKILLQPDGKILIAGAFKVLNGIATNDIVRLRPDGTIDSTFNAPVFYRDVQSFAVTNMALQSNGKILVCGLFSLVGGEMRSSFARLNPDGSVDTTFPHLFPTNIVNDVRQIHVFPDDSFLIGGNFNINSPNGVRSNLARLNSDGSIDSSFTYAATGRLSKFVLQSDGKILVGWTLVGEQNSFPYVTRITDNGSLDSTFAQISVQANTGISDLKYLPDGKILIGGSFNSVNGINRFGLFRANSDGTVDTTFQNTGLSGGGITVITLDTNGKLYIGGYYDQIGGLATQRRIHRINADGTLDTTFGFFNLSYSAIIDIFIQADGKIIVLGQGVQEPILRITPNGGKDSAFIAPKVEYSGTGFDVLVQPDNKILVGGRFTFANGINRPTLTRLNADGTIDTGFLMSSFSSSQIYDIALQPDGKILIAGAGIARRLNANGTVDVTFNETNVFWDIEYLPDGKILIGGVTLHRYNSNGTLDTTLATVIGGDPFPRINEMAVQPDGKIIIVGNFLTVNGASRNRIARLNSDGTFDASFNPPGGANADIYAVTLQSNGKILVGGNFTGFNGDSNKKYLARLNADGSIDTSFAINLNAPVIRIKIQSDGRILIGGSMSVVNGASRPGIARINADGSLDTNFNAGTGTNSTVWSLDQQSDGKIIYVGQFTRTNGFSTLGVGRLLNSSVTARPLFDFDGDGKADVSVYRASTNTWYRILSGNSSVSQNNFGSTGDITSPADFDGDGKTDLAIFRPSTGTWWYQSSINNAQIATQYGQSGDIPRPSDFDGDGKADFIIFRPSENNWYRLGSTGLASTKNFGAFGDKPVIGDFDGDGKSDVAIYRPSTGTWWYQSSVNNAQIATQFGISSDVPTPADFDGDGKTDLAVFRPSTGVWYILNSSTGSATIVQFGIAEDKPVAADYDGDGKSDIAVFRPSSGLWYLLRSTSGFSALQFGISSDVALPNSFIQ